MRVSNILLFVAVDKAVMQEAVKPKSDQKRPTGTLFYERRK